MNQNIKQIVNQVCEQNNLPFTPEHNKAYVLDNFAEQLAELIIKECTSLLFEESERLYAYASECDNLHHSDEADICAEKCIDVIAMIEEHFGVK